MYVKLNTISSVSHMTKMDENNTFILNCFFKRPILYIYVYFKIINSRFKGTH